MVRVDSKPTRVQDTPEFKRLQKIKNKKEKLQTPKDFERRERKWKRNRISTCCFGYMIIAIVLAILTLAMFAKTGLFEIPVFTKYFYQQPQPTRVVVPTDSDTIENIITQNFAGLTPSKELNFVLTEGQLTTMLNEPIAANDDSSIDQLQAVITTKNIEIFGHLNEPVDAYLTLGVVPIAKDGLFDFDVTNIALGNMPIPTILANFIIDNVLRSQIEEYNKTITEFGNITSIALEETKLNINAQLK
ncbi:hypothetical protein KKA15_01245 [Patescibacteria group bacterium]|nr:hypothetical protein [Patescibacteria group bacterium]